MNTDLDDLMERFEVKKLTPFGLEITAKQPGDIAEFIQGKLLKELTRAFFLIILRQFKELDKAQLVDYAKTIGPLLEWEFGSVMEMKAQEKPKNYLFTNGKVPFHWDGAFYQEPRYLLFHCIQAPLETCGGETLFTHTNLLWQEATDKEKTAWKKLQLTYQTEKLAHYGGCITIPLVKTHPETNDIILRFAEPVPENMLNPVAVFLDGHHENESHDFITNMGERCYADNYCYTHTWQKNDFLIADNHMLIHARHAFKQFSPRHLRRIQVL